MTDHYLRFPTPAAMLEALRPLGMTYTDDEGIEHASQGSHQYALHEVGEIEGVEGWHVNLRIIDPEFDVSALAEFEVHPEAPRCVWA
jgi:hypothetical protein